MQSTLMNISIFLYIQSSDASSVINLLACKYSSLPFYNWKYLSILKDFYSKAPAYVSLQVHVIFHRLIPELSMKKPGVKVTWSSRQKDWQWWVKRSTKILKSSQFLPIPCFSLVNFISACIFSLLGGREGRERLDLFVWVFWGSCLFLWVGCCFFGVFCGVFFS